MGMLKYKLRLIVIVAAQKLYSE